MQPTTEPSFIVRLLSKYDYPTKFLFISLLFAFSILVSNYFMIRGQNEKIRFAQVELVGTTYEMNLRKLLETVIKHQLTELHSGDDAVMKTEGNNLRQQVSSEFTNIKALDVELEDVLKTSAADFQQREKSYLRPAELESKWNDLVREGEGLKAEHSETVHERILKDIVGLITYISDTSNLYLDPYMNSTYIANVTYLVIPNVEILIPRIILQIREMNSKKPESITPADRFALSSMIAILDKYRTQIREEIDKVIVDEKNGESSVEVEGKVKDPLNVFLINLTEFINAVKKNYILTNEIKDDQANIFSLGTRVVNAGFAFWDISNEQIVLIFQERIDMFKTQQLMALLVSFLCALVGFTLGFIVMNEISRPMLKLLTAAKQLAGGDLSVRIPITVQDEVGQVGLAFNQMVDALHELIGRLQWTGIQLTTSTTEISAAAKEQEATVVQQEATTKQIAVTAKEISATAKDFAMTMNTISNTAEQTSALATMVKTGLVRMESVMHQMVDASANIASKLAVLNEKAGNITTVITTITKVADQTNLLSLNAAIEAEKAGEHGRSFAVIAREIRRLADQTANATLDIEKMVNEIVSAVSAGVMGVDKFSEEIHSGVNQVSVISDQLGKIIEQVQEVTESFESVNQGMQAQSIGAEQINESITQLSSAAQQTTASIRQFHNAIDQLNNAAQEMQTAVSKIKR